VIFSQKEEKRDSIPAVQVKLLNINFKDFIIKDKLVYAITNDDRLITLNIAKNKFKDTKQTFSSIALNSSNRIIGVTRDGIVKEQNKKNKYVKRDKVDGEVYKILVDKNDDFIVITDEYIRYKNENFIPEKSSPMYRKAGRIIGGKKLIPADYYFLDKEQNIWFSYDAGEWGGDVCFFNLVSKEFIYDKWLSLEENEKSNDRKEYFKKLQSKFSDKIKIIQNDTIYKFPYQLSISSGMKGVVFDQYENIFISSSRMHFFIDGSISKISKTDLKGFYKFCFDEDILDQIITKDTLDKKTYLNRNIKEYLGPLAFNKFNNSIYFYSSYGFYKLTGNDCKNSKEFIFKPWIYWKAGLPDAVGYQMNLTKFDFISEKEIIFLTAMNGIGYFDGETVKYFK
jgi:hypothetical protein